VTENASTTLAELRARRDEIVNISRRHHGRSIRVFGSVARGEDRRDSDVDFLVRFDQSASLFDLLHMQDELGELLGRSVDVVSETALKLRDEHIRDEAVLV
jgi:hypothetical protein